MPRLITSSTHPLDGNAQEFPNVLNVLFRLLGQVLVLFDRRDGRLPPLEILVHDLALFQVLEIGREVVNKVARLRVLLR